MNLKFFVILDRVLLRHLQLVTFKYSGVDDLLSAYARLKKMGIEPLCSADRGATTALSYLDPDGHCVELVAENSGDQEESGNYMRTTPEFGALTMGTSLDADKLIAARQEGTSLEELHRRACAGEFTPSNSAEPARHCSTDFL